MVDFRPLPQRRVAERTFAWRGRNRDLSKDHEHTTASSATAIRIVAVHRLLQRLYSRRKCYTQRFRFQKSGKRAA
jgi:transposase